MFSEMMDKDQMFSQLKNKNYKTDNDILCQNYGVTKYEYLKFDSSM
jgi:hypothetical protein